MEVSPCKTSRHATSKQKSRFVSGSYRAGTLPKSAERSSRVRTIPKPIASAELPRSILPLRSKTEDEQGTEKMTLERGSLRGFEHDRMVMLFSMMDGATEVSCAVSSSAMDDLERGVRAKPDQRDEQFLRLRDRIEQCASRKFLAREFEGRPPGIILRSIDFRP
jgi:hypothetical protein